jgi:hypothetical protein
MVGRGRTARGRWAPRLEQENVARQILLHRGGRYKRHADPGGGADADHRPGAGYGAGMTTVLA